MEKKFSVPGLAQGIGLLRLFERYGELRHDEVFKLSKIPKSTVSRQLETLCQLGLVRRSGKVYRALFQLTEVGSGAVGFIGRVRFILDSLAERTECCAEWYEIDDSEIKLIERSEPKIEGYIRVIIREGGCFYMKGRFNALKRIAMLCEVPAVDKPDWWDWLESREKIRLTDEDLEKALLKVKEDGLIAYDPAYNSYGVKRCAVAVTYPGSDELRGILVLAVSKPDQEESLDVGHFYKELKWGSNILTKLPRE